MSDAYAYLNSGKLKFPEEHAKWRDEMAAKGLARIGAENAAKAEQKAERERKKSEAAEVKAAKKGISKEEGPIEKNFDFGLGDGDETGATEKRKKSVFGFLKRGVNGDGEDDVVR